MTSLDQYTPEELETVRQLINKYDPIGLLGVGAPDDEYSSEAKMIARMVKPALSSEQLLDGVHAVFVVQFFTISGDRDKYAPLANELFEAFHTEETI